MKEDTHPESRPVIFHDTTSGEKFLFDSTVATEETGEYEGDEYPKTSVEMSSQSHPFYTGVERVVDTTGQVEKFKARFEQAESHQSESADNEAEPQEDDTEDSGDNESDSSDDEVSADANT